LGTTVFFRLRVSLENAPNCTHELGLSIAAWRALSSALKRHLLLNETGLISSFSYRRLFVRATQTPRPTKLQGLFLALSFLWSHAVFVPFRWTLIFFNFFVNFPGGRSCTLGNGGAFPDFAI